MGKFVSFEQEWAELRAAAAARGAMQINSVPAEGAGVIPVIWWSTGTTSALSEMTPMTCG